jgi:hypothetical protein
LFRNILDIYELHVVSVTVTIGAVPFSNQILIMSCRYMQHVTSNVVHATRFPSAVNGLPGCMQAKADYFIGFDFCDDGVHEKDWHCPKRGTLAT